MDYAITGKLRNADNTFSGLCKGFFINVAEAVQRTPWTRPRGVQVVRLTCGSRIVSYEAGCLLPGKCHMRLMGYPKSYNYHVVTDAQLKTISGNAYMLCQYMAAAFAAEAVCNVGYT